MSRAVEQAWRCEKELRDVLNEDGGGGERFSTSPLNHFKQKRGAVNTGGVRSLSALQIYKSGLDEAHVDH